MLVEKAAGEVIFNQFTTHMRLMSSRNLLRSPSALTQRVRDRRAHSAVAPVWTHTHRCCEVLGSRFRCLYLDRRAATLTTARSGQCALDHGLTLLGERSPFLPALSKIYGVDLAQGFHQTIFIEAVQPDAAFRRDAAYRAEVIDALTRDAPGSSGFVAARPAPGMLRQAAEPLSAAVRQDEAMRLCHLFGSAGFAQLCDPVLEKPIPLFVRPWCRGTGLLAPVTLPSEPFSAALTVERVGVGRMVLFQSSGEAAR